MGGKSIMKVAIVYFSLTGNTEKAALEIEKQLENKGIKVSRIKLHGNPGTFMGNLLKALFRIKSNLKTASYDMKEFDFIVLGSPVWMFSPTPQVNTFFKKCGGMEGKNAIVFVTYGSGTGKERAINIMKQSLIKKGVKEVYCFSISDKITKDGENLKKKIEFALESSPFSYEKDGVQNV
jgi:flavodoxin